MGGHGPGGVASRHSFAWSIDPLADLEWREETDLTRARDEAVAVGVDGLVYLLAGHSQSPNIVLNTIERYDPAKFGFWENRQSLTVGRRFPGAAVVAGQIYVFGGYDNTGDKLGSMERYTPSTDSVSLLPGMSTPRSHMGVCVVGDRIYTLGGLNGSQ